MLTSKWRLFVFDSLPTGVEKSLVKHWGVTVSLRANKEVQAANARPKPAGTNLVRPRKVIVNVKRH